MFVTAEQLALGLKGHSMRATYLTSDGVVHYRAALTGVIKDSDKGLAFEIEALPDAEAKSNDG
jgi:hypothetical protein